MSRKSIKEILKDFGLAENQIKIYIYLAKQGVLKGGAIVKQTKIPKAVVYRTLKILQHKGFVESTLEFPTRYTAVPFETILDSNIKAKKEEALQIENSKRDLLEDWKKISKGRPEQSIEKFVVIDGDRKIFAKIYQMATQTKNQLFAASSISDLFRADRYGVFDAIYDHPSKSKIQFRFLTDLRDAKIGTIKILKNRLRSDLDFRGRNPELGIALFPRMVIRDNEEILLFISDKEKTNSGTDKQTCLCTNCKSIIQSYSGVFEDLWQNSTEIKRWIYSIETGIYPAKTQLIKDPSIAEKLYNKVLASAKKEILIITSSVGLNRIFKDKSKLIKRFKEGLTIKIMAPITGKNLSASQKLSEYCEVRHISMGYLETTIIDKEHLFQFKYPLSDQPDKGEIPYFNDTLYTNDLNQVTQSRNMYTIIWKNALIPSAITLNSIETLIINTLKPSPEDSTSRYLSKMYGIKYLKDEKPFEELAEKDVLEILLNARKMSSTKLSTNVVRQTGSYGRAIIHPPKQLGLPEIAFNIQHYGKYSTLGAEDSIIVSILQDTPFGKAYVPAAFVGDNPKALDFVKVLFKDNVPKDNFYLVKKEELQIRVHGKNLFCGWTMPITLFNNLILPPASILLEGYGNIKTRSFSLVYPSGYRLDHVRNYYETFVTFFHPASKYSGPGTDGIFARDAIMDMYKQ